MQGLIGRAGMMGSLGPMGTQGPIGRAGMMGSHDRVSVGDPYTHPDGNMLRRLNAFHDYAAFGYHAERMFQHLLSNDALDSICSRVAPRWSAKHHGHCRSGCLLPVAAAAATNEVATTIVKAPPAPAAAETVMPLDMDDVDVAVGGGSVDELGGGGGGARIDDESGGRLDERHHRHFDLFRAAMECDGGGRIARDRCGDVLGNICSRFFFYMHDTELYWKVMAGTNRTAQLLVFPDDPDLGSVLVAATLGASPPVDTIFETARYLEGLTLRTLVDAYNQILYLGCAPLQIVLELAIAQHLLLDAMMDIGADAATYTTIGAAINRRRNALNRTMRDLRRQQAAAST